MACKQIVILSASPNPETSTTRRALRALFDRIAQRGGPPATTIDIPLLPGLTALTRETVGPELEAALHATETAGLIVAATPVYKGSYPGLFKHFIDLLDYRSLVGVPVGLLATGGSQRHALVVEHQLRPLFGFFQAHVLGTGVFLTPRDISEADQLAPEIEQRVDRLAHEIVTALDYSSALTVGEQRDAA